MLLPFGKPILTSPFGNRDIGGRVEFHAGIDLIPSGSGLWIGKNGKYCDGNTVKITEQINKRLATPIVSCLDGIIVFSGYLSGGGYTVIIDSMVSTGELPTPIRVAYSHLQENLPVAAGEHVTEGQIIGYMGYSDVVFEQTHLHLGLSVNPGREPQFVYHDNQQNPIGFLFGYHWNAQEGSNEIILRS